LKIDLKIMGMIRACFGQRPEVVVEWLYWKRRSTTDCSAWEEINRTAVLLRLADTVVHQNVRRRMAIFGSPSCVLRRLKEQCYGLMCRTSVTNTACLTAFRRRQRFVFCAGVCDPRIEIRRSDTCMGTCRVSAWPHLLWRLSDCTCSVNHVLKKLPLVGSKLQ
jgi:hypothetical protein